MDALMKYDTGRVATGFTDLAFKLSSGTSDLLEHWTKINRFKFRDREGRHWTQGLCSKRWFRHDGQAWRAASSPPGPLEGPAEFAALSPLQGAVANSRPPVDLPGRDAPARQAHDGIAVMEKIVAGICSDYDQGLYPSDAAERLLQDHYLTDRGGVIWTLGCRSRTWYSYKGGKWEESAHPPAATSLPAPEEMEAIHEEVRMSLLMLFASDEPLPETIALPWRPPVDIPEKPRFCTLCLGVNPVDSAFCRLCGAPADKLVDDPDKLPRKAEPPNAKPWPCPKCGKPNAEDASFCQYCGSRIEKKPAARVCAACGQALEPDARFCDQCGRKAS
jgi:hypothetical protein